LGVVVLVVAILALRTPSRSAAVAGAEAAMTRPSASPSGGAANAPASASTSGSPTTGSPTTGTRTSTGTLPTTANPTGPRAAGSQPLIVLNNSGTAHLAHQAAARFEAAGWTVTTTDEHYVNSILSTVAYYDPALKGAKRAALALQRQFPTIKRVVPRFPELPDGPVVVVLTTDYSSS
jgi:hypothetical protein